MNLKDIFHHRFKKINPPEEEELQAAITSHPNGLIVIQLNYSLQSIFLNEIEATAIAKALLMEARKVKIAAINGKYKIGV